MTPDEELAQLGYTVFNDVYEQRHIDAIVKVIDQANKNRPTFRISNDLFAIRQFLKELPELCPLIFTDQLKRIIQNSYSEGYFAVKSIYFDKPGQSNWFVAYHQDLTISVDKKADISGFGPWTVKHNQFAVQPPLGILRKNFTIRIHLDDTDQDNGALKVVPGSHLKDVYRAENIDWGIETEHTCNVKAGGIMIMSPLLLHASNRTVNDKKRRVIHIEFSKAELPEGLQWSEKISW